MLRRDLRRALVLTTSLSGAACASSAPTASRAVVANTPALRLDATASAWGPWSLRNGSDAAVLVESAQRAVVSIEVMDDAGAWRAVSFRAPSVCSPSHTAEALVPPGARVDLGQPAVSPWRAPVGTYRARALVRSPPNGPRWEVTTRFEVRPASTELRARARTLLAEGIREGCTVDTGTADYLFVAPREEVLSYRDGRLLQGLAPFERFVILATTHLDVLAPLLQDRDRARAFTAASAIRAALTPRVDWIEPQIEARLAEVLDAPRPSAVETPEAEPPRNHAGAAHDTTHRARCEAVDASLRALFPPRDDGPPVSFAVEGRTVRLVDPADPADPAVAAGDEGRRARGAAPREKGILPRRIGERAAREGPRPGEGAQDVDGRSSRGGDGGALVVAGAAEALRGARWDRSELRSARGIVAERRQSLSWE